MKPIFLSAHILILSLGGLTACLPVSTTDHPSNTTDSTLSYIHLVNLQFQKTHPLLPVDSFPFAPYTNNSPFWDNAAYHTGNMEVCRLVRDFALTDDRWEKEADYTKRWAEAAHYMGATSNDTASWQYQYGETPNHVLFGDWQICFQTYADLYEQSHDDEMIARARGVMEYEMQTLKTDYLWWADGLYMVMPVMTKLYRITGNPFYLKRLEDYFQYAKELMYSYQYHLFFRDGKYIYPTHMTESGKPDFWARGNGWVFAALAKVQTDLQWALHRQPNVPAIQKALKEFQTIYLQMAEAIAACQEKEGYWSRSMLDPQQAAGYETSGTAFFAYGLYWGINNHLLEAEQYLPVADRAWHYLTHIALQDDGVLGYVQPIGECAIQGQELSARTTANFGVGAFLLAACEKYRQQTALEQSSTPQRKNFFAPKSSRTVVNKWMR